MILKIIIYDNLLVSNDVIKITRIGSKKCKAHLRKGLGFSSIVGRWEKTFDLMTSVSGGLVFPKLFQSTTLTQGPFYHVYGMYRIDVKNRLKTMVLGCTAAFCLPRKKLLSFHRLPYTMFLHFLQILTYHTVSHQ